MVTMEFREILLPSRTFTLSPIRYGENGSLEDQESLI